MDKEYAWFCKRCGKRIEDKCTCGSISKTYRPVNPNSDAVSSRSGWPLHSYAAGVLPNQIKEAMENDRRMGVPTDRDNRGRAIFRDRNHRKRWLKAHNRVDADSYTGY